MKFEQPLRMLAAFGYPASPMTDISHMESTPRPNTVKTVPSTIKIMIDARILFTKNCFDLETDPF